MATRTWSAAADGNWSLAANWDGGLSVPSSTDAIIFDVTSVKNCTLDNLGSWSGGTVTMSSSYGGIIAQNTGINFTAAAFVQNSGTFTCHAAATFTCTTYSITGGTFTQGGAFTCTTFGVTATGVYAGSAAAMSTAAVTFSNTATLTATSGTWTCTGNMTKANSPTFNANGGSLLLSGSTNQTIDMASLTLGTVTITKSGTATVGVSSGTTIPLGTDPTVTLAGSVTFNSGSTCTATGIITVIGPGASAINLLFNSGCTLSGTVTDINCTECGLSASATTWPTAVNIKFTQTSSTSRGLTSPTRTFGTFRRTGSGTGTCQFIAVSATCTFTTFRDNDGSAAHALQLFTSTTITADTFTLAGSAGNLLTINTTSGGTPAIMHSTGNAVTADYMSIKDSTVDASPVWTATHSTNVSGNTNWVFQSANTGVTGGRSRQSSTTRTGRGTGRERQSA